MTGLAARYTRYKLRLRRKRLLWRAFRRRREINSVLRRTELIKAGDVLVFACLRNEMQRLPFFLEHYRKLGVAQFLLVDNGSDDGSVKFLVKQPDVSLWRATSSYKASRFGMDWLTALLWKHGTEHWCLTVDLDELLIYPDCDTLDLPAFTRSLEHRGQGALGALLLDLYPKGPIGAQTYTPGDDPTRTLPWFDAYGYWAQRQNKMGNLWLQGGARARCFFEKTPELAPTLNKIPLVHWRKPYVYVNSTHNALPPDLNRVYDEDGFSKVSGVLLHTKFLPDAPARAASERSRGEHFADAKRYNDYYEAVTEGPDLWCDTSVRLDGWRQLLSLGLMSRGD